MRACSGKGSCVHGTLPAHKRRETSLGRALQPNDQDMGSASVVHEGDRPRCIAAGCGGNCSCCAQESSMIKY